jgi:hypothetical protein
VLGLTPLPAQARDKPSAGAASSAALAAVACTTTGCNGRDPQSSGCSADARTLDSGKAKNGIWIELRYSPACYAVWTRYESNGAAGTGTSRLRPVCER